MDVTLKLLLNKILCYLFHNSQFHNVIPVVSKTEGCPKKPDSAYIIQGAGGCLLPACSEQSDVKCVKFTHRLNHAFFTKICKQQRDHGYTLDKL